jgi:xylose isomerase domain protein TIM barrel
MIKKMLILVASCALLLGCAGVDSGKTSAGKHRKIALHGYVYSKVKTLEETVKEAKALGADGVVCSGTQKIGGKFKDVKFSPKMTSEQKAFVKKLFADNNIAFVSYGIWDVKKGETPDLYLSFCREMGIPVFTWEGKKENVGQWNEAAEKYGVKVAIHNHQKGCTKNDEYVYWNPEELWKIIKDKKNVYACADNGHWTRSSLDTPSGYRALHGKFLAIHFKDPAQFGVLQSKTDAPLGEGVLDMKKCLQTLDELGYDGYFVLENECVMDNPTETMRKSIKFLREN